MCNLLSPTFTGYQKFPLHLLNIFIYLNFSSRLVSVKQIHWDARNSVDVRI